MALARDNDRVNTLAAVFVFGLTALVFIQFAPFRGAMVGAVDVTTRLTSPYVEELESYTRPQNTLQTDQTDTIAMVASFWRDVQHGQLKMWEPDIGTGVPLGGVIYTYVWSPFYWPGVLVPPPALTSFAAWFALWVAQLGAWALARRLGIGWIGSVLVGVAYGFSGPVTASLLRINETALAPWVILAVHVLISHRRRHSVAPVAGLSVAVAAMWLSGFPAASVFTLYAAAAIAIATAARLFRRDWRTLLQRLALTAAGLVGGTILVAPLLLPSYEFLSASEALARSFGPNHAAGFVLFGTSVSGRILGTFPGRDWWWPDRGYSNTFEASMTIGAVVLLFLFVGAISRRCRPSPEASRTIGRVYMPLGLVIFVGTFLGGPVLGALEELPFVGSNSFGRSRFLLSLVLALAAGNALDGVVRSRDDSSPRDVYFRGFALMAVVAGVWSAGLVLRRAAEEGFLDRAVRALVVPGICLVAGVILGAILLTKSTWLRSATTSGLFGLAIVALVVVELQWGAWGFVPVVDRQEGFYPYHSSFDLMTPGVTEGMWRFAGTDLSVIRPNEAAWLGMSDLRASSPTSQTYRQLMRAIDPDVFSQARLRTWFTSALDPSSPGLDRSAVRYIVAPGVNGVLDAVPKEQIPLVDGSVFLDEGETAARGLRWSFESDRCLGGFITVRSPDGVVAREPLWRIGNRPFGGPVDVALPDIKQPMRLNVSVTGCGVVLPAEVTVLRALPGSRIRALSAVGAVYYERLDARPRVELAGAVMGISDPDARLEWLVTSKAADTVILNDEQPLTRLGGGSVKILNEDGNNLTIEVHSQGRGFLVVRDSNAPGWQAIINGEPADILSADHAYRSVEVPGGRSIVTMSYRPHSCDLGLWLAGAVCAIFAVWAIHGHLTIRSSTSAPPPSERP